MTVTWTSTEIVGGYYVAPYDLVELVDGRQVLVKGVYRHPSFQDNVKLELVDGTIIEGFSSYKVVQRRQY